MSANLPQVIQNNGLMMGILTHELLGNPPPASTRAELDNWISTNGLANTWTFDPNDPWSFGHGCAQMMKEVLPSFNVCIDRGWDVWLQIDLGTMAITQIYQDPAPNAANGQAQTIGDYAVCKFKEA